MTISFDHTIVYANDRQESAYFLTTLFGLPDPVPAGPFLAVEIDGDVTLDFANIGPDAEVLPQHYCFRVTEADFDAIYQRIQDRKLPHWADPFQRDADVFNTNDGGRGVYFLDPNGHYLEIITRRYGSGS